MGHHLVVSKSEWYEQTKAKDVTLYDHQRYETLIQKHKVWGPFTHVVGVKMLKGFKGEERIDALYEKSLPKATGDCYEANGRKMTDLWLEHKSKGWVVAHGTVWHEKVGWHGHAWLEHGDTVEDFANARHIIMPKAVYYSLGRVKDVKTYKDKEFSELLLKHMHWGPFE